LLSLLRASTTAPAPAAIPTCPAPSNSRCRHPRPVTRLRNRRLVVNRQWRRRDIDADADRFAPAHEGYWGPEVGFYGGVSYGYGYGGVGYEGGYWRGGAFFYNRSVNNFSNVQITNVYNKTVVVNDTTNVSYNGGTGGTTAQATPQQIAAPICTMCHRRPNKRSTCKWRRKIRRCRSTTIMAIRPLRRPATRRN
jgi:hypothetical protein